MKYLNILIIFLATFQIYGCDAGNEPDLIVDSKEKSKDSAVMASVEIKITIDGEVLFATLNRSETAKDFASLFPLTITLNDYAYTEKIWYPDRKLSIKGAQPGIDPEIGDITYYAPWGNLAIFYKDFGYAEGLIKLGEIDGDMSVFESGKTLEATFELLK